MKVISFIFLLASSCAQLENHFKIKNIPEKIVKNPEQFWIINLTSDYAKYCPRFRFFWIINTEDNQSDLLIEEVGGQNTIRDYNRKVPFDFGNKIISRILSEDKNELSYERLILLKNLILDPRSQVLDSNFYEQPKEFLEAWNGIEKIEDLNHKKHFPLIDKGKEYCRFYCITYLGAIYSADPIFLSLIILRFKKQK